jgi:molybdenum cofactor cytidylyltransferase
MVKDAQLGIIILAAGKASRMGEPKALLSYNERSFLLNTYHIAQSVHPTGIVTVLGHYYDQMSAHCDTHKIPFILNDAYENGMSSSIQCGLTYLLSHYPQVNMVLILLADQPKINAEHISALLHKIRSSKYLMVCTAYSSTYGVPAVFKKEYFHELLALKGEKGAKNLIEKGVLNHENTVLCEDGRIDIDTPEDYLKLRAEKEILK